MAEIKIDKAERILAQLAKYQPDSPQMKQALFVIGTIVSTQAKENLKTAKPAPAFDSGFLHGKIGFQLEGSGDVSRVVVGAFGVKYARMVEFGGVMTKRQLAAMFASFNETKKKKFAPKGIIKNRVYAARPYLTPALEQSRAEIVKTLSKIRE